MKLKDNNLVEWLRGRPDRDFPRNKAYFPPYQSLADYLNKEVHPLVSTGAALSSGIFLNDHGPGHVQCVIDRASQLVSAKECDLSGYEVYLLLAAIQVHDAGNILGRAGHEQQLRRWETKLDLLLGDETIERRTILQIAEAHGGSRNGNKDTISHLANQMTILGKSVRPRLVAAILRFADELADDTTRAARFGMDVGAIPDSSLIFHKYSAALHSVVIDLRGSTIELHFELLDVDAKRLFIKHGAPVYLLDEIIDRTLKMHSERIYCSRFLRPHISLDRIGVKINVYPSDPPEARYGDELITIAYRLEDRGYPESRSILDLAPELSDWCGRGVPLNGKALVAFLEGKET